jgi:hypothetical protein
MLATVRVTGGRWIGTRRYSERDGLLQRVDLVYSEKRSAEVLLREVVIHDLYPVPRLQSTATIPSQAF